MVSKARINLPVALALTLVAQLAWGQGPSAPEEAARLGLIEKAKASHAAGDHRTALDLAERAAAIQQTPTLRYFLAYEQQELGQLAEAYGNAQQCARDFDLDRQLPKRDQYLSACRTLRDQLGGRVGYLVLQLSKVPEALSVKIKGQEMKHALFGVPYPVTPGTVAVEASAPGHNPFRTEITVVAGAPFELRISLTEAPLAQNPAVCPPGYSRQGGNCVLAPALAEAATGAGATGSESAILREQASAAKPEPRGHRRLGVVLAIAGVAAAVASGISYGVADSRFKSLRSECDRGCTAERAESGKNTVRTLDRLTVGSAILGGGLLLSGTAFFLSGTW